MIDYYWSQIVKRTGIYEYYGTMTSPDKNWLFFNGSYVENLTSGLYRININGTQLSKISDHQIYQPWGMLNNTYMAFIDETTLYVMSTNGTILLTASLEDEILPHASLDSEWFFYRQRNVGFFRYHIPTKTSEFILTGAQWERGHIWYLDNHKLLFDNYDAVTDTEELVLYCIEKQEATQLAIFSGRTNYEHQSLSPNGQWFIASHDETIYSIDLVNNKTMAQ